MFFRNYRGRKLAKKLVILSRKGTISRHTIETLSAKNGYIVPKADTITIQRLSTIEDGYEAIWVWWRGKNVFRIQNGTFSGGELKHVIIWEHGDWEKIVDEAYKEVARRPQS